MNSHKVGMVLGTFFAIIKLIWVVLVGLGLAQGLADFLAKAAMVKPTLMVTAFDLGSAVELVIVTFVIGYVMGWIFAKCWHKVR